MLEGCGNNSGGGVFFLKKKHTRAFPATFLLFSPAPFLPAMMKYDVQTNRWTECEEWMRKEKGGIEFLLYDLICGTNMPTPTKAVTLSIVSPCVSVDALGKWHKYSPTFVISYLT